MKGNGFNHLVLALLLGVSLGQGEGHSLAPDSDDTANLIAAENTEGGKAVPLKIVSRSEWNALQTKSRYRSISQPAKYVIITDEGGRCYKMEDCIARVQHAQNISIEDGRDYLDTFYLGDDGIAYEGLGWEIDDRDVKTHVDECTLWITFLGKFQDQLPSSTAMDTFKALMDFAVSSGKLIPEFRIMPFLVYNNNATYLGKMLEEDVRTWDHYSDQLDLCTENEYSTAGQFPIVFREEWFAENMNGNFTSHSKPVSFVVVLEHRDRCHETDMCAGYLREDQEAGIQTSTDVPYNFYVAEDGLAYEGRGWDLSPSDDFPDIRNNYIEVAVFGKFDVYSPSRRALLALKKLVKIGLWLGKITPVYSVMSISDLNGGSMSENLYNQLKEMEGFSDQL